MRRVSLIIFVLLLLTSLASAQNSIKLPPHKKVVLPNGLTVLLMEQHEVPFVTMNMLVRAGGLADPQGKEGVAGMTADMMRKGTKTRSAEKLAEQMDFIGGSFDFNAGGDFTIGRAEFLKKDLDYSLDIITDALMNPTFPQEEFTKLQKQDIDALKEIKDNPGAAIRLYYTAYLYGNHPYGRSTAGDENSLAGITRDDVVKFYENYYVPANTIMAVVGDFSTADMEKVISNRFGNWQPKSNLKQAKLNEPEQIKGKRLLFVDKPDATQTYFMIGNVGISRTNPDRVGVDIINTLFGERFTSLLNSELRIKTGLTYGARSFFTQRQMAGPFAISTYTRNATTEQAIDLALAILNRLHEKGITEEQLKSTKEYIKGQFGPTIETPNALAGTLVQLEFYGLDEKEINDYFAQIDAFTLKDAQRVIATYFPKDNLVFTIVGKNDEVGKLMKKYAPQVDNKKIEAPGFK